MEAIKQQTIERFSSIWKEHLLDKGGYKFFAPILPNINTFLAEYNTGDKILDIGCGFGEKANVFDRLGFEVTGTDISQDRIEVAQTTYTNIKFVCCDLNKKLPFEDNSFDLIFSCSVFQYIEHEQTLAECRRVLKNNGGMILVENLKHNPITRLGRGYLKITGHNFQSYPWNHFTLNEVNKIGLEFSCFDVKVFHLLTMFHSIVPINPVFNLLNIIDKHLLKMQLLKHFAWLVLFTAINKKC